MSVLVMDVLVSIDLTLVEEVTLVDNTIIVSSLINSTLDTLERYVVVYLFLIIEKLLLTSL